MNLDDEWIENEPFSTLSRSSGFMPTWLTRTSLNARTFSNAKGSFCSLGGGLTTGCSTDEAGEVS